MSPPFRGEMTRTTLASTRASRSPIAATRIAMPDAPGSGTRSGAERLARDALEFDHRDARRAARFHADTARNDPPLGTPMRSRIARIRWKTFDRRSSSKPKRPCENFNAVSMLTVRPATCPRRCRLPPAGTAGVILYCRADAGRRVGPRCLRLHGFQADVPDPGRGNPTAFTFPIGVETATGARDARDHWRAELSDRSPHGLEIAHQDFMCGAPGSQVSVAVPACARDVRELGELEVEALTGRRSIETFRLTPGLVIWLRVSAKGRPSPWA